MNGNDHNRWSEDLAAYMLGALEPREAAEFERHLEGCERCRGEMRWLEPALQLLPESVERQEPPPRLRQALMAEVRADVGEDPGGERSGLLPEWLRRGFGTRGLRLATGLAAIALVVAVVAGYEIGKGGSDGEERPTTLVTHEHGVTVKMVREGDGGTLHLAKLHQLPPDKVLEAWVRREGTIEAVPALLVPDRKGQAETTIADMSGVDTVMVTEEPQGGSDEPTGDAIVTMTVPQ
ncbi:MAG TPA: anti-sigma factor [Solirubrobacterales bacterium]|nr:anti-sigma factor [Solirubrobacterales bacterium]